MKARYRLTPKADQDLAQIWRHTNENWGKSQANKYLQLLEKAGDEYADSPLPVTWKSFTVRQCRGVPIARKDVYFPFTS